jgi:2-polyprenyl-3-methyl-5-hydroxy-6-metoxy-1,4-benzoquinol methylase
MTEAMPAQAEDQARWELVPCPVCGAATFERLFEKGGEPFVQCTACGLILINPRPPREVIAATYNSAYTLDYIRKQDRKLRRIRRWVKRIQRAYVRHGRWLDIGCSAGFVMHCARQAGFEAWGVDVEPAATAYARSRLGLDHVYTGALEAQAFPAGHFDVISAYELIEHVPDPDRLVAEISRLLAPHGIVEIRTPDAGHWRLPARLETWEAVLPSEHLYYFTRRTLGRLLMKHGLEVIHRRLSLKPGLKIYAAHRPA